MINGATNEVALTPELKEMYRVIDACKDNSDEFKFDLDDIWRPLGYSRVDSAVYQVKKMNCGEDYEFSRTPRKTSRKGGRPRKVYLLSANGLEKLATACGTEIGKQVREYLISLRHAVRDGDLKVAEEIVANRSRIAGTEVLLGASNRDPSGQKTRIAEMPSFETSGPELPPSDEFVRQKHAILEDRKMKIMIHESKVLEHKHVMTSLKHQREKYTIQQSAKKQKLMDIKENMDLLTSIGASNEYMKKVLISEARNVLMPDPNILQIEEGPYSRWISIAKIMVLSGYRWGGRSPSVVGKAVASYVRSNIPNEEDRNHDMQRMEVGEVYLPNGMRVNPWHYRGEGRRLAEEKMREIFTTSSTPQNQNPQNMGNRITRFFRSIGN